MFSPEHGSENRIHWLEVMRMLFVKETLVAVFAAVGIGTVLYASLRPFFTLPKRFFSPVLFVLRIDADTPAVEDTVRELQELCRDYGENARIAIVDAGMSEEQKRLVRILRREDDSILLLEECRELGVRN